MKHLPPRVSEAEARAAAEKKSLTGRIFASLLPHCKPQPDGPLAKLPRLEMVWMPYHIFDIGLSIPGNEEKSISLSIDGHTGSFALFEMHAWMQEGTPESAFAPEVNRDRAEHLGRQQFLSLLLRQRGRQKRPIPGETRQHYVVHFPVWVYFFARRGRYIDVIAVDAITGERCPARRRAGVLRAFELAAEAKEKSPPPA